MVEADGRQSDVVLIPHRRGDDGYFMLLVTPPSADGDTLREILPESEPTELLILADTSASLDAGARANQAQFIAAVLESLGPKDTFNLAGCDVNCDWVFEKTMAADAKNVDTARKFLARRVSLGWTDLDGAFASALGKCGPKTRVLYVGDGIPTTGDANAVDFSRRLKQLYQGKTATYYAVSVGSQFESGVLKTIASLGGGAVKQISGERSPQVIARELLAEIARPGVRDVKVRFPRAAHCASVSRGIAEHFVRLATDHLGPIPARGSRPTG